MIGLAFAADTGQMSTSLDRARSDELCRTTGCLATDSTVRLRKVLDAPRSYTCRPVPRTPHAGAACDEDGAFSCRTPNDDALSCRAGPFQAGALPEFNVALTELGVITDICRWTLPVPLTPLPLRSDASRRSGRGFVRVPSGPRPRALQFFGLFGWGGAHRLAASRPQRCCTTLCESSAFLTPSSPLLRGHVGHCSAPALRRSPAVERSGLPPPPHGRLSPGPPA